MKHVVYTMLAGLLFATPLSAAEWDGSYTVKVSSKNSFTLPFTVKGKNVKVKKFGTSMASKVSEATYKSDNIQFTVEFAGKKCGAGSYATLTLNPKGKGTWDGVCMHASGKIKFRSPTKKLKKV